MKDGKVEEIWQFIYVREKLKKSWKIGFPLCEMLMSSYYWTVYNGATGNTQV